MNEVMNDSLKMTPKEIVEYLDNYIIGQKDAKKAIAIALRNRYRRMKLEKDLQDEVMPKNILMIGSTGVGKTEIARRLAKMMSLPFVKVEASKFTEVGFVGRDVESMVRDLVIASYNLVSKEHKEKNISDIAEYVVDKITQRLLPPLPKGATQAKKDDYEVSFAKMKEKVKTDQMDHLKIEIDMPKNSISAEDSGSNLPPEILKMQESLGKMFSALNDKDNIKREVTIKEAKEILQIEASESLLDKSAIKVEAIKRAKDGGIIFIDEIDKVAVSSKSQGRNDPSKEGVQRDLLPIVEGSTVNTKHGQIDTDHILFIAAGAFHMSKPSDLIAELQGRFPLRVELESLDEEALYSILTKTKNSLLTQYKALLSVEDVELEFDDESIRTIAKLSQLANEKTEDIGARRLHTVIERVLEDISFEADQKAGEKVTVTKDLVNDKLEDLVADEDVARYIL
jgi:ATP-dependent HslUV protease ATP-binding subunit HslU